MRSMTRWTLAGFMALAALSAVAVLDVGSTTAEAAPSVSPFAGSWSGWGHNVPQTALGVNLDWTISDKGRISGTVYAIATGESGAIVGHVGADGKLVFVGFAPADAPAPGTVIGAPLLGTAVIVGDTLYVSVTHAYSPFVPVVAILYRN